MNNYLITIVGATAIGKTSLSIALAKHFNTAIISCDSRQFYKEMQIGTAVPTEKELSEVPHHFIQNRSIHNEYSVGQFEKEALLKSEQLFENNTFVVMVGGSGLYVDAVLKGLDYFPEIDSKIRVNLNEQLQKEGLESLQAQLEYIDPETFNTIDIKNPHRVIRALEVCLGSKNKYSYYKNKKKTPRNFTAIKIGIDADRPIIYRRIEERVDLMMREGLLEEAKKLHQYKELNALQTVGYRELFQYFDTDFSLEFAVSEIKKNTRRFAKRQNTWFKKDKEIKWFDYRDDYTEVIKYIENFVEKIN